MKEDFLHYLWKFQKFNTSNLETSDGKPIQIIKIGEHNTTHSGPDFFNAQIIIDNQWWAGNLEIHLKSSDWYAHQHQNDTNYDTVILHVVWEHDIEVFRNSNIPIPTIALKKLTPIKALKYYEDLMLKKSKWINCEGQLSKISDFTWNNWLERLYLERLSKKSDHIAQIHLELNKHWEATCFSLISQYFGGNTNGKAFLQIAKSIPFSILQKTTSVKQLEALLFGQANLLNKNSEDSYYQSLQQEYNYLKHKYKLTTIIGLELQFFRLRPSNFPTIRLAQLAQLYSTHHQLFTRVHSETNLKKLHCLFNVGTSPYWETHYNFEKESNKTTKQTTSSFIDLLIINALLPLQFSYSKNSSKPIENDLLQLISEIKAEKNSIVDGFKKEKRELKNALHSQAVIQLKKEYCNLNNCLKCAVGFELLKE